MQQAFTIIGHCIEIMGFIYLGILILKEIKPYSLSLAISHLMFSSFFLASTVFYLSFGVMLKKDLMPLLFVLIISIIFLINPILDIVFDYIDIEFEDENEEKEDNETEDK